MDEVLVKNDVYESVLSKRIVEVAIYLLLFLFAVVMVLVGVTHFTEGKILSGAFYSLMGGVGAALIGVYKRREF